jgi:hypothetical protein
MKKVQVLMAMLVFAGLGFTALGQELPKFALTITDSGIGVLPWLERVLIFTYDPVAKVRGEEPFARVDKSSLPPPFSPIPINLKLVLPQGWYEIVIVGLKYGRELVMLTLGRVELNSDLVFDMAKVAAPYEWFLPA